MATEGTLISRVRAIDLRVIDRVLAAALTADALVDTGALAGGGLSTVAVVSCIVLTGSIAWSRTNPVVTALVATSALVVFELVSGYAGDGLFESVAIAWVFFMLGHRPVGRSYVLVSAAVLSYWVAGSVAIGLNTPGGAFANVSFWTLSGVLPFAVGRTLAARGALTQALEEHAVRLQDDHTVQAQLAAAEERRRAARELHDVVAHCVSVMVVQTGGARRVARSDLDAARDALRVVEGAGREALVELRRIIGVLHRGNDGAGGVVTPGVAHLDALVDRARAAGLPVELSIEGRRDSLSPGVELVVYRVVQEALTNALKHAGPARARVRLTFGARELEVEVSDSGSGQASGPDDGSGHGLVGMSERVRLYGGELRAAPGAHGGFEVRARIPFDGTASHPQKLSGASAVERSRSPAAADRISCRWLDPLLALVFLVILETAALTGHGTVRSRDVVVLAAMAVACIWRRRRALWFTIAVVTMTFALSGQVAPRSSTFTAIYVGLIPGYAVAAWEDRRNAWLGLAVLVSSSALAQLLVHHVQVANYATALFTIGVAWAAGRAIRARRVAAATAERSTARLAAERDDRVELAVAGERSRIARELHAVVAQSVEAMVIQAEASHGLLGDGPDVADAALEAIQRTGREALGEMRRILGVLRHQDDRSELMPQPGVDQIYGLIQHARQQGQQVELSVDGDPGALSASVDLGIYRILEEALKSVARRPATTVGVAFDFGQDDLVLQLTANCPEAGSWPTDAMRARIAVCRGELHAIPHEAGGWRLIARMPRDLHGALA